MQLDLRELHVLGRRVLPTQSLSNLRTVLARLRQQVGEHLIITHKTVAVTRAVHEQTDSVRFQAMLKGMGKEGNEKSRDP